MRELLTEPLGVIDFGNSENVLKGELIDGFAVAHHNAIKITLLVGITDIVPNDWL